MSNTTPPFPIPKPEWMTRAEAAPTLAPKPAPEPAAEPVAAWQWQQCLSRQPGVWPHNWNNIEAGEDNRVQYWRDLAAKIPDEVRVRRLYAATALESVQAELAEVQAELSDWRNGDLRGVQMHLEAVTRSNAALREALEPFANLADDYLSDTENFDDATIMAGRITRRGSSDTPPRVLFSDFRRARTALGRG